MIVRAHFHHLTYKDRLHIEAYLKAKLTTKEIAELIGVHVSTVNREIQRGAYQHRNSDWTEETRYSPELAEENYRAHLRDKGQQRKLDLDREQRKDLEELILKKKCSPYAALQKIKKEGKATVCVGTCYNYINNNLFPNITLTDLPYRRRKKKNRYQDRIQKRGPRKRGRSIEERPERISLRMERGHWEMDTVVGRRATKNCLLVLTERKTRYEIVRLLKEHTTEEVVKALDRLEREIGEKVFRKIFQSITMDNGSEFMDFEGIMRSRRNKMNRTETYYCHAYSSWERGSNENQNRFIRRYIPKGQSFEKCCKKDVQEIEDWMNSYPRQMFDGRSAEDLFLEEFQENPWRKAG